MSSRRGDINQDSISPPITPPPPPYHSIGGGNNILVIESDPDGFISERSREDPTVPDPRRLSVADEIPHIDHYRNVISMRLNGPQSGRPSLAELHLRIDDLPEPRGEFVREAATVPGQKRKTKAPVKFGWITGVLVRCILSILGAVLYLRLSWITGQAGVALATLIVFLSYVVTTLTAISMCAISTNGEIKGGGAYYMLSRSLGPEFGGSMGVMFSIANAFAAALHTVGFAETVRDLLKAHGLTIIDGGRNDIRILGILTLCLLISIVVVGVDFESKAQLGLLVILVVSYVNYVIGTFLPVSEYKRARGVTGYSWKTFTSNIPPAWSGEDFYSVFGVYFPSATGIMAGANISGDLKEPGKAIPKGTLLALLLTFVMYIGAIWLPAATCIREATGEVDIFNGTMSFVECSSNNDTACTYGLLNHFQVMELESAFGPLITAGIFAATLSSGLVCLVSSPKLLQAVGRDKLFPGLEHLATGYGRNDEPRRAYVVAFLISLVMVCVGDLNAIAPFISNFYLATYTLVNYACFDCSLAKSHGWRPAFRYYNKWLSLLGACLCVTAMFLMSWWSALLTIVFVLCLYVYLLRSKPDVNWGSSSQARTYNVALQGMLKLLATEEHVKNYRPQILALCGNPIGRAAFVDFVRNITGQKSLLILGHFVKGNPNSTMYDSLKNWTSNIYGWLHKRNVKAFYIPVAASNMRDGFQSMLQMAGLGKLRPNIVMLGFKNNWKKSSPEEIDQYFQLIHEAFDGHLAVGVLRVRDGLDYMDVMREQNVCGAQHFANSPPIRPKLTTDQVTDQPQSDPSNQSTTTSDPAIGLKPRKSKRKPFSIYTLGTETVKALAATVENFDLSLLNTSQSQRRVLASVNQFQTKVKKGVVDVWWLADDGGLTLLIPYILTHHRSFLYGSKLRLFTGSSGKQTIQKEHRNISALLQKFRIDFSDVHILNDLHVQPQLSSVNEFEAMIEPFMIRTDNDQARSPNGVFITERELEVMKERTNRHLRIRELLMQHSKDSALTVVSMPVPRKGGVSACLYMAWLEILVKDLSPVLLIRGNQQPVLTFYS